MTKAEILAAIEEYKLHVPNDSVERHLLLLALLAMVCELLPD